MTVHAIAVIYRCLWRLRDWWLEARLQVARWLLEGVRAEMERSR
jgi:hypothetical protein